MVTMVDFYVNIGLTEDIISNASWQATIAKKNLILYSKCGKCIVTTPEEWEAIKQCSYPDTKFLMDISFV